MASIERVAGWTADRVFASNGPGIVFVRTIGKCRALAQAISEITGKTIPAVTSKMPKAERDALAKRLDAHDAAVPLVVATSAWATGIDIPNLRWIAYADRMQAPIFTIQAAGRGSRISDGKQDFDIYDLQGDETSRARAQHTAALCDDAATVEELARSREDAPPRDERESTRRLRVQPRQVSKKDPADDQFNLQCWVGFVAVCVILALVIICC
jgi:superfamily II DNA helicase RecQ